MLIENLQSIARICPAAAGVGNDVVPPDDLVERRT